MATPKDILVVTSSTLEGVKIKRYLKPVSAHVVAGTNLFSDFMGGLTDVFGGRSQSYQNQLASLYNDAISRIKISAYEIGANCVIGLSIDMDEISGKGKSMFMLTAVGTAVILEKEAIVNTTATTSEGVLENVGVDKINILRRKKVTIEKANEDQLQLTDDTWSFISENQIPEVFPFLLRRFDYAVKNEISPNDSDGFYKLFLGYMDTLQDIVKIRLLYEAIQEHSNNRLARKLSKMVKELNLYDHERISELLESADFEVQKSGLRLSLSDKPFYNHQDIGGIQSLITFIQNHFKERGTRALKKGLISKEKEVWVCECGKSNDIDEHCSGCKQDIYGFKETEVNPKEAINHLTQKVELIKEFIT